MAQQRLDVSWTPMYAGDDGWPATAPVGRYPKGASPFGVLDMAGNVWEWTADGFADYSSEPATNPEVSRHDESPRVTRGGAWLSEVAARVRATDRLGLAPGCRINSLGFRCARGSNHSPAE
jgi:formylglycine-generating enzyme required for sulfatase activity